MSYFRLKNLIRESWPSWLEPKTNRRIGLDIGSGALAFVECQGRHGQSLVSRWGCHHMGPQIIEQGRIQNRPALLGALNSLVEQFGLKGASVAMAVNGASVMVKRISVSPVSSG